MAGGSRVKDLLLLGQFGPSVKGERRRKISEGPRSPVKPLIHLLKSTHPPTGSQKEVEEGASRIQRGKRSLRGAYSGW